MSNLTDQYIYEVKRLHNEAWKNYQNSQFALSESYEIYHSRIKEKDHAEKEWLKLYDLLRRMKRG